MEVLLLPQETAGACWISVGTVLNFRLQNHPALSSALTFSFPRGISNSPLPGWHFFSLLLMDGFLAVWKLQQGIVTEPCHGDWQVCTHSGQGRPRNTDDISHVKAEERMHLVGWGATKIGFSPWALRRQWGQSRVWIWCMGLLSCMKGRQSKMNRINSYRKQETLD